MDYVPTTFILVNLIGW